MFFSFFSQAQACVGFCETWWQLKPVSWQLPPPPPTRQAGPPRSGVILVLLLPYYLPSVTAGIKTCRLFFLASFVFFLATCVNCQQTTASHSPMHTYQAELKTSKLYRKSWVSFGIYFLSTFVSCQVDILHPTISRLSFTPSSSGA